MFKKYRHKESGEVVEARLIEDKLVYEIKFPYPCRGFYYNRSEEFEQQYEPIE